MPKICSTETCKYPVFGKGYCKVHQYMRQDDKKPKPPRKISDKHSVELKKYSKLASEYKQNNPLCMAKLKGCTRFTTDVHHRSKRGKNLNNVDTWMPICRNCHKIVEDEMSSKEAREKGLRI